MLKIASEFSIEYKISFNAYLVFMMYHLRSPLKGVSRQAISMKMNGIYLVLNRAWVCPLAA
jgi:hypothetical protein